MKIVVVSIVRSLKTAITVLINPSHPLSLRTAILREWMITYFGYDYEIMYSEPDSHDTQRIEEEEFTTYVIPTTKPTDIKDADAVIIYCHGGGLMIGHPLQYLKEYKRWVNHAARLGKKLVILAPQYPLSPQKRWPAQRDSVLGVYSWALSKSVSPSRIIIAGDSGGSDLACLTLLYLRDHGHSQGLPQMCCGIFISPYFDYTHAETKDSYNINYDFISTSSSMNDTLRPEDLPFDTPEISPVLVEDIGGLPPQLVYWSPTELLATDASRWIKRSREAGVEITEHSAPGQLHTYSLGWPFVGKKLQDECDTLLMNFIFSHVK